MKEKYAHHIPFAVQKAQRRASEADDQHNQGRRARRHPLMTTGIGWILQGGVILSAAVILFGMFLLPLRPGGFSPQRVLAFPHTLNQVGAGLLTLRPQAVMTLGLLLLIATPVVRVAASVVAFAFERDRRYVIITLIVLALLLLSLFFGATSPTNGPSDASLHLSFSFSVALLIFLGSLLAGLLGSLVGLGGGILIVPMFTLAFRLPISFAIGTSVISVIATSSGAAAAYVRDHLTNMRVGMFLELATTTGAICGAFLAGILAPSLLGVIFGIILLLSAAPLVFKIGEELPEGVTNDRLAHALDLASSYPDHQLGREVSYQVTRTPLGLGMMYIAGLISGLLGIGSGPLR